MIVSFRSLHDCLCYNFTRFSFFAVYTIFILFFFCFPLIKKIEAESPYVSRLSALAESKGFEPSKRFWRLHDFQSCSFDQLGQLSVSAIKCSIIIYEPEQKIKCFFIKIRNDLFFYTRSGSWMPKSRSILHWNEDLPRRWQLPLANRRYLMYYIM